MICSPSPRLFSSKTAATAPISVLLPPVVVASALFVWSISTSCRHPIPTQRKMLQMGSRRETRPRRIGPLVPLWWEPKGPWARRLIDSFKQDPNFSIVAKQTGGEFDHRAAAERTANSGLAKHLKARHMQMIVIGGAIGDVDGSVAIWRPHDR